MVLRFLVFDFVFYLGPLPVDGHEFEQALVIVMDQEIWHTAVHGVAKS